VAQVTEGFIQIDQELCTGCGNCATTCPSEAISGERNKPHTISEQRCLACGRCVQVCNAHDSIFQKYATSRAKRLRQRELPSGLKEPLFAAYDRCLIPGVKAALSDPDRVVLVQVGPTVCDTVAEDFGLAAGSLKPGRIVAALKKVGFSKVYSFNFAAALAVLEQAYELVDRLHSGRLLPVINSSCPACVKFIEQFHPELIHYLAGCKSPHQIAGALLKSYVAEKLKVDSSKIYGVSIGSCTSRKIEAGRPEMNFSGHPDVDAVLTARDLAYLFKDYGIELSEMSEAEFDRELPEIAGMESVYCSPGDITAAVLYAGRGLIDQGKSEALDVKFVETGTEGVQMASVRLDKFDLKVVSITGLPNAVPFFDAMKAGKHEIAFLEILSCPMGCVSGGGQPKVLLPQDKVSTYSERANLSSKPDAKAFGSIAKHPAVQQVYQGFFAKACGDKSNRAINTQYSERKLSD
jgi:NADP-reducing hydrogenase subunit HndD